MVGRIPATPVALIITHAGHPFASRSIPGGRANAPLRRFTGRDAGRMPAPATADVMEDRNAPGLLRDRGRSALALYYARDQLAVSQRFESQEEFGDHLRDLALPDAPVRATSVISTTSLTARSFIWMKSRLRLSASSSVAALAQRSSICGLL